MCLYILGGGGSLTYSNIVITCPSNHMTLPVIRPHHIMSPSMLYAKARPSAALSLKYKQQSFSKTSSGGNTTLLHREASVKQLASVPPKSQLDSCSIVL